MYRLHIKSIIIIENLNLHHFSFSWFYPVFTLFLNFFPWLLWNYILYTDSVSVRLCLQSHECNTKVKMKIYFTLFYSHMSEIGMNIELSKGYGITNASKKNLYKKEQFEHFGLKLVWWTECMSLPQMWMLRS